MEALRIADRGMYAEEEKSAAYYLCRNDNTSKRMPLIDLSPTLGIPKQVVGCTNPLHLQKNDLCWHSFRQGE